MRVHELGHKVRQGREDVLALERVAECARERPQELVRGLRVLPGEEGEGGRQEPAKAEHQGAQGHPGKYGQGDVQDEVERGAEAAVQGPVLHAGHGAAEHGQGGRADCV